MEKEQTLAIIKPDGIEHTKEIINIKKIKSFFKSYKH